MTKILGKWMMGYGAFLVAMGLAGYLSNPDKAVTALIPVVSSAACPSCGAG